MQCIGNEHPAVATVPFFDRADECFVVGQSCRDLGAVHVAGGERINERFVFVDFSSQGLGDEVG